jgi:hypothetical protein
MASTPAEGVGFAPPRLQPGAQRVTVLRPRVSRLGSNQFAATLTSILTGIEGDGGRGAGGEECAWMQAYINEAAERKKDDEASARRKS